MFRKKKSREETIAEILGIDESEDLSRENEDLSRKENDTPASGETDGSAFSCPYTREDAASFSEAFRQRPDCTDSRGSASAAEDPAGGRRNARKPVRSGHRALPIMTASGILILAVMLISGFTLRSQIGAAGLSQDPSSGYGQNSQMPGSQGGQSGQMPGSQGGQNGPSPDSSSDDSYDTGVPGSGNSDSSSQSDADGSDEISAAGSVAASGYSPLLTAAASDSGSSTTDENSGATQLPGQNSSGNGSSGSMNGGTPPTGTMPQSGGAFYEISRLLTDESGNEALQILFGTSLAAAALWLAAALILLIRFALRRGRDHGARRVCPVCGTRLRDSDRYCPGCGRECFRDGAASGTRTAS